MSDLKAIRENLQKVEKKALFIFSQYTIDVVACDIDPVNNKISLQFIDPEGQINSILGDIKKIAPFKKIDLDKDHLALAL